MGLDRINTQFIESTGSLLQVNALNIEMLPASCDKIRKIHLQTDVIKRRLIG